MFKSREFYFLFLLTTIVSCSSAQVSVGTFWQITDIHLEVNYSRTGDINDDCRGVNISEKELGEFGDFFCDSPLKLVEDAVKNMKIIQSNPDFILWTGDSFPHLYDNDYDWDMVFSTLNDLTSIITSAFPNTVIVPIIGNHDVHPSYNFPWNSYEHFSEDFLTKGGWSTLIPEDQHENFKKGGYFSVSVSPQLTILALNTFLYGTSNYGDDPKDQLKWFKDQLELANNTHTSVIITSHIPPTCYINGQQLLKSPYVEEYLKIINEYSHVISTQIYGHLHIDTFSVGYDDDGTLKWSAFMGPSVTPWKYPRDASTGNNPGVRLYKYHRYSGDILDYDQYSLDLLKANEIADDGEEAKPWKLLYSAAEIYEVPNLNVTSMGEVYRKISCDDTFFDKYLELYQFGVVQDCNDECKKLFKCTIISLTKAHWSACTKSGVTFLENC